MVAKSPAASTKPQCTEVCTDHQTQLVSFTPKILLTQSEDLFDPHGLARLTEQIWDRRLKHPV